MQMEMTRKWKYIIHQTKQSTAKSIVVQSISHIHLCVTPWTAACQAPLFSTVSPSLPKFMFIESVMLCNHLILCYPLFFLLSIFPGTRDISNESTLCIRWAQYWNLSFSMSPSSEYAGLISFRTDWFDLLAVQGTLKGRLQGEEPRWRRNRMGDHFLPYKFIERTIER